ncbi:MAG: SUMF1/EgtB/PvdO family nonheme iron enzyme [Prolixibacteraceae bacterium]|jgi:formylglycine-generating enzyme|nr:SUMF1/EgtB/PvdO family nonheme iron enzyme [Prolixibacteraceae bacterium]MBT6764842.1 SUMF1/EgtB/PvdO family nonheme iron enzyme [Prolixibacteraceae bacterium]MBT6998126.1 SUMF1/EgtB/PvdO family nonheme iron enzyme [Prolixibacteraceae bacterium]MBT7393942.1 SUMF1/EgtB/PvdO family nonheme iron enzyme [Prolixibacteraceae bacterium]
MRKATIYLSIALGLLFYSCQKPNIYLPGEERKNEAWFEPTPFGMVYVQRGAYLIGPSDDEVLQTSTPSKTVSAEAFWMDDTEITNNEYRQFVYWVRDSIARRLLGETYADFLITETSRGVPLKEARLNWEEKIDWKDSEYQMAMEELFIPEGEHFVFNKEIDTRNLVYDYYWVDYKQAAKRQNSFDFETQSYNGNIINQDGEITPIENRGTFLMHERIPVYPDTLSWIRDFTYTYNDPYTMKYFSHVGFDNYPVVGVTWDQANAFCNWRTNLQIKYSKRLNETPAHDYRLPTETEWELAARGGLNNTIYPWGTYYTRNVQGCFVANFKPLRGNYVSDSPTTTTAMRTGEFDPNNYGLYDMAGNVAEWTSTAFFEAGYDIIDDINPEVQYDAKPDDPAVMKRKVIRGGSWKDIAYFIRTSTRSFEYQDTTKSYIGFRCVRTSFRNDLQNR